MTEPVYLHAIAQPLAWSPSTNGRVSGTPVLVDVSAPADFETYRGKLNGAIVMNDRPRTTPATSFTPIATRFTDDEIAHGSAAIDPTQRILGSATYVRNHFGDPRTMALKPEHAKLAGYFNLDNGTGKIPDRRRWDRRAFYGWI